MKKTQEQKMEEKLQKLQEILAHIRYLQDLISKYEYQIERLMKKMPALSLEHSDLLKDLDQIKTSMSEAKSNFYDSALKYWKADSADSEKMALAEFHSSKKQYGILKRKKMQVSEQYEKNTDSNSTIDSIIHLRISSISRLKFQIAILSLRTQRLENALIPYIGETLLNKVYLNPDVTPQPAYVPAKKQVLKKN